MHQIMASALVTVLTMSPLAAAQVPTVPNPAQAIISGNVVSLGGQPLTNTVVQARSLLTGAIGGSTSTTAAGQFVLNVNSGSYVLEIVDAGGQIVGTSSFISAGAGAAVTALTVTATSSVLGVVSNATGFAAVLAAPGAAALGLTIAAAAAGVAGVIVPPGVPIASPSR